MKILKITIRNLNSLKLQQTIDFAASPLGDTGLFAIVGDTGAGKTTILDAITLSLYGLIHRNDNKVPQEVMSYGTADCLAETEFDVDGTIYRTKWNLRRARNKVDGNFQTPRRELSQWNPKTKEFEIIAEKKSEFKAKVTEITGLNYEQFCRSILLAQGDFAAFLKAKESERSDLLEQITGTEVYTDLSKAAYERWKLEERKLRKLEEQRAALQLLSSEEVTELKTARATATAASAKVQTEKQFVDAQLHLLERIRELEARKLKVIAALEILQVQKQAAAIDFEQLRRHEQAMPLQADLKQWRSLEEQQAQLQVILEALTKKLTELEQQQIGVQVTLQETQTAFETLKAAETPNQELYRAVHVLDVEILALQRQGRQQQVEFDKQEALQSDYLEEQKKKSASIANLVDTLTIHQTWLQANAQQEHLGQDLPKLEVAIETHNRLIQQSETTKARLAKLSEQLNTQQKEATTRQEHIEQLNRKLEEVCFEFQSKTPVDYPTSSRTEILHQLSETVESMTVELHTLRQLETAVRQQQRLTTQQTSIQSNYAALKIQLEQAEAKQQQAETTHAYKVHAYEQQQAIAKHEQHRVELKKGEACPLCLSMEQPFRAGSWKSEFVNTAKTELQGAKKTLQTTQKQLDKVRKESNTAEGKLAQLVEELAATNTQISAFQANKTIPIDQLEEQIEATKITVQDQQTTRRILLQIDTQVREIERQLQTETQAINQFQLNYTRLESEQTQAQAQYETQQADLVVQQNHCKELVQPYLETAWEIDTVLSRLSAQQGNFKKHQTQAKQQEQQLQQDHQRIELLQKQIRTQTEVVKKLRANLTQTSIELKEKQKQRFEYFQDKNLEKEQQQFAQRLKVAEKKYQTSQNTWQALQQQFAIKRNEEQNTKEQLQQITYKIQELHAQLQTRSQHAQFDAIEALEKAILAPETATKISQLQREIQTNRLSSERILNETNTQLQEVIASCQSTQTEAALQVQQQNYQAEQQQLQRELGKLQQQLDIQTRQQQQAQKLLQASTIQQQEYNRWEQLREVIGMESGKKFRIFAQGLTLQRLVQLANGHLHRLNDRYLIQKHSHQDLALDIIDGYQANNIRSMNTLSGGESFLLSLALALGLSDLAGQNTNIRSLFIDEGFGTLDEDTLDLAISTLENLQASGKTIGVISHVKALKERITTQIYVKKQASGFSKISILPEV